MRIRFVLALVLAAIGAPADAQQTAVTPTLVRAGRVLDVRSGAYRDNQGIWVEGGRIRQIGGFDAVRTAAPKDVAFIDLSDATILPGLIDCHSHLLAAMDPTVSSADNLLMVLTKDPPTRRALLGAAIAREALDAGFTSVRNVGHSGIDGDVSLRDAVQNGWVMGPRITAAGRKIAPYGGQALRLQSGVGTVVIDQDFLPVATPDEGRRAVLENLRVGADVIKVVVDDWPRVIGEDTLRAVVNEAHRVSVRVAAHATTRVGIQAAIAAGVDSIEHGDEATDEQFQAMRDKGIFLVPTLYPRDLLPVSRELAARPDLEALKDAFMASQRSKLDRARKAGVRIAFGSDMWFTYGDKRRGEATRRLLEALQEFGMSSADVLRAATVTAADLLNASQERGTLEMGKYADMVAVTGDPLANVRELAKVTFVMKDGVVVRDDTRTPRARRN